MRQQRLRSLHPSQDGIEDGVKVGINPFCSQVSTSGVPHFSRYSGLGEEEGTVQVLCECMLMCSYSYISLGVYAPPSRLSLCVCVWCVSQCVFGLSPSALHLFSFSELSHMHNPSNSQAYVVQVTLSDGSKYSTFRRYSEFHDMNQKLEERFPVDAGYFNYGQRTLPEMPGKILFGRSAVRNVAEQRLPQLNEYLKVRQHLMVVPSSAILCCDYTVSRRACARYLLWNIHMQQ